MIRGGAKGHLNRLFGAIGTNAGRRLAAVFVLFFVLSLLALLPGGASEVFAAGDSMHIYPNGNTTYPNGNVGYISDKSDAAVDKSVFIERTPNAGNNTIHWKITFNPGQEKWLGGSIVYVWLPARTNVISVTETLNLKNGSIYTTTYSENDFGLRLTSSDGFSGNSWRYLYGTTNFENEYTERLLRTEIGGLGTITDDKINAANMTDLNAWMDQGKFSSVIIKINGTLNTLTSKRNITIWEFDTVHNAGTDLATVPIVAGMVQTLDHGDPRFIAQGPFAPEVTVDPVTSNPNAASGDTYYTEARSITVTGTGSPGAALTLTYGSGQTKTITVGNDGNWTTSLTGVDVGTTITAIISKTFQEGTYSAQDSAVVTDATAPKIVTPEGMSTFTVGDTFPDAWNLETGNDHGAGARENVGIEAVTLSFHGSTVSASDSQRLATITDTSAGITFQVADKDNVNKNGQAGGNDRFVGAIGFTGTATKVGFFRGEWTVTDLAGNTSSPAVQTIKVNPVAPDPVEVSGTTLSSADKDAIKAAVSQANGITGDTDYTVTVGDTISNGEVTVTIVQDGYEQQPFTVNAPVVKASIIENPTEAQQADTDYVLITFDANDLNNGTGEEVIRGRLDSRKTPALVDQETITYAVMKGTKWSDFASVAATPDLDRRSPYWLFAQSTPYSADSWKTTRNGTDAGTATILPYDSTANVESIFGTGQRQITYYAQYGQNVPAGTAPEDMMIPVLMVAMAMQLTILFLIRIVCKRIEAYEYWE